MSMKGWRIGLGVNGICCCCRRFGFDFYYYILNFFKEIGKKEIKVD